MLDKEVFRWMLDAMNCMKIITLFTIFIAVTNCSGDSFKDKESPPSPKSSVEYCLEQLLDDYYLHFEEIKADLINDGIVDDSKNSYANLYETIDEFEYTHTSIDKMKNMQYQFLDGLGPHFPIFNCSRLSKTDSVLTPNQRKFYEFFETSGKTGSFSSDSVAQLIRSMSEAEFNSNSVKKTTVFLLGHNYIFHRYCCVME